MKGPVNFTLLRHSRAAGSYGFGRINSATILRPNILAMKLLVYFSKSGICNVGIDLGCGDGSMAEHCLDASDVGAVY